MSDRFVDRNVDRGHAHREYDKSRDEYVKGRYERERDYSRDGISRDDRGSERRNRSDGQDSWYREDKDRGAREDRYRDDKHRDDKHRDDRHREHKYRDDRYKSIRDDRYRDDRNREDQHSRDDKYRDERHRDDKHRDDRYRDDRNRSSREDRYTNEKYRDDRYRDSRHKDHYRHSTTTPSSTSAKQAEISESLISLVEYCIYAAAQAMNVLPGKNTYTHRFSALYSAECWTRVLAALDQDVKGVLHFEEEPNQGVSAIEIVYLAACAQQMYTASKQALQEIHGLLASLSECRDVESGVDQTDVPSEGMQNALQKLLRAADFIKTDNIYFHKSPLNFLEELKSVEERCSSVVDTLIGAWQAECQLEFRALLREWETEEEERRMQTAGPAPIGHTVETELFPRKPELATKFSQFPLSFQETASFVCNKEINPITVTPVMKQAFNEEIQSLAQQINDTTYAKAMAAKWPNILSKLSSRTHKDDSLYQMHMKKQETLLKQQKEEASNIVYGRLGRAMPTDVYTLNREELVGIHSNTKKKDVGTYLQDLQSRFGAGAQ